MAHGPVGHLLRVLTVAAPLVPQLVQNPQIVGQNAALQRAATW